MFPDTAEMVTIIKFNRIITHNSGSLSRTFRFHSEKNQTASNEDKTLLEIIETKVQEKKNSYNISHFKNLSIYHPYAEICLKLVDCIKVLSLICRV